MSEVDVLVVGKGNAALCAALAARDTGASVAMIEAAPEDESGGNSRFAGGVLRFVYDSVEDLQRFVDIPEDEAKNADWESNTREQFYDDLYRVTSFRTDPNLSETLVTLSLDTMLWLRAQGVRFIPNYRNTGTVDGRKKFAGRMPVEVNGGGAGLVEY
ncbi:MAG: FAD-binding protein, partial [Burkholderiales bacterium]